MKAEKIMAASPESIDSYVRSLAEHPISAFVLVTLAAIVVARYFHQEGFFGLWLNRHTFKLKRLRVLQELTNSDDVNYVIKNRTESIAFTAVTKINAEAAQKSHLVYLHKRFSHRINWTSLKRTQQYLRFTATLGKFRIEFYRFDILSSYISLWLGTLFISTFGCVLAYLLSFGIEFLIYGSATALNLSSIRALLVFLIYTLFFGSISLHNFHRSRTVKNTIKVLDPNYPLTLRGQRKNKPDHLIELSAEE